MAGATIVEVLVPQGAILSGMGIEAGDGEPRARNAEAAAHVARYDARSLCDQVDGEPDEDFLQRQVNGDRHHGQFR